MLEVVRNQYQKSDFWSEVAKHLYPTITIFKPKIDWSSIIQKFIDEFRNIEEHRSIILETTGETSVEFLTRLVSGLMLKGNIERNDNNRFLNAILSHSDIPEFNSEYANALILKACLELGRFRPATSKIFSIVEFAKEPRTVYTFIECPLDKPLPKMKDFDTLRMPPNEYAEITNKLRSTADYHLAASYHLAEFEYHSSIGDISKRFYDMDEAYRILKDNKRVTSKDEIFINQYQRMRKAMP